MHFKTVQIKGDEKTLHTRQTMHMQKEIEKEKAFVSLMIDREIEVMKCLHMGDNRKRVE